MREAPCKGCVEPERFLGCHSVCKKYIDFKEQTEKEKAERRKKKYIENSVNEVLNKGKRRKR